MSRARAYPMRVRAHLVENLGHRSWKLNFKSITLLDLDLDPVTH